VVNAMTSEDIGKEFAKNVLAAAGSDDPALLGAMASVSRENHLFAPPWWIASESSGWWTSSDIHDLYQDTIVALDKSRGINNGSPLLWARALSAVSIKAGDRIQHVGCGGGYYSAILAELVGPEGTVHAWDVDEAMARPAARALQGYGNVTVGPGNPLTGPVGDYDGIVSSAGLSDIPRSWMLSRPQPKYLVFPLGGIDSWLTDYGERQHGTRGGLVVASRIRPDVFRATITQAVSFYPCDGARNAELNARILKAFGSGDWRDVRYLRFGDEPRMETGRAWLRGNG
jgi:protein-L-isoaspartate(D-aspartate) O-methyltransferase